LNWRKHVILKKFLRYGTAPIRIISNYSEDNDKLYNPPVVVNSFPKSGTHLLLQIIQVLPGLRDWGFFLASTPSFSFKERPDRTMANKISTISNRELVLAHIFFSKDICSALFNRKAVQYFIYRDPRDVAISEAYYLTYSNKWHKLHKYYRSLPDMNSRILFSIRGAKHNKLYDYPDINRRFKRYKPWISQTNVLSLKFEDLVSSKRKESVQKIMKFYTDRVDYNLNIENLVKTALANINPLKSHTFRIGKPSIWKEMFTPNHKAEFKKIAGNLLVEMDYERDFSW
jgi:hypothetical protein